MSEWIDVNHKLPHYGTDCICYIKDRHSVILCKFYKDFTLVRCSIADGFSDHGVTHWMPLPEPPK